MAHLLTVDPARAEQELTRAREAEALQRIWRRRWLRVYAECIGFAAGGTLLYAASWGLPGDAGVLLSATGQVVAYGFPFFRLIFFFVRNADQF
jgi:hypothetical protein